MLKTKAAILYEAGADQKYHLATLGLKPPAEKEVLVRMATAGLCGSDENVRLGKRPHPLPVVCGHEGAGFVEGIGKGVKSVKEGDIVILNWQPSCGGCAECVRGKPYLCSIYPERVTKEEARFFLEDGRPVFSYSHIGCFAERTVVRESCCIPLREKISLEVAALIGCAVTTGVGAVFNSAKIRAGESVAIFGMGGVGLSILMGAKLAGANPIIAIDPSPAKKEIALALGATDFLSSGTGIRKVDYVFDAVGHPEVTRQCFESLAPSGTLICVGLPAMKAEFSIPTWGLVCGERKIIGSVYGAADPKKFFPQIVSLYSEKKLPLDRLVSKVYPLEQINEGVAAMRGGKIARVVIQFTDEYLMSDNHGKH